MSIKNTFYRIQCIADYQYHDELFATIKELLETWGEKLNLTRGKVRGIIKQNAIINRHPNILITKMVHTT